MENPLLQQIGLFSKRHNKFLSLEQLATEFNQQVHLLQLNVQCYEQFVQRAKFLWSPQHVALMRRTIPVLDVGLKEIRLMQSELRTCKRDIEGLTSYAGEVIQKCRKIFEVLTKEAKDSEKIFHQKLSQVWREKTDLSLLNQKLEERRIEDEELLHKKSAHIQELMMKGEKLEDSNALQFKLLMEKEEMLVALRKFLFRTLSEYKGEWSSFSKKAKEEIATYLSFLQQTKTEVMTSIAVNRSQDLAVLSKMSATENAMLVERQQRQTETELYQQERRQLAQVTEAASACQVENATLKRELEQVEEKYHSLYSTHQDVLTQYKNLTQLYNTLSADKDDVESRLAQSLERENNINQQMAELSSSCQCQQLKSCLLSLQETSKREMNDAENQRQELLSSLQFLEEKWQREKEEQTLKYTKLWEMNVQEENRRREAEESIQHLQQERDQYIQELQFKDDALRALREECHMMSSARKVEEKASKMEAHLIEYPCIKKEPMEDIHLMDDSRECKKRAAPWSEPSISAIGYPSKSHEHYTSDEEDCVLLLEE